MRLTPWWIEQLAQQQRAREPAPQYPNVPPAAQQRQPGLLETMHPLDKAAIATWAAPGVGDFVGLLADARMYKEEPESRTLGNGLLTILGALPLVPAASQGKKLLDMSKEARMQRAADQGFDPYTTWYHGSPDARGIKEEGFKTPQERYSGKDSGRAFFFSRDRSTAASYADPRRAFDYQGSEPAVIAAKLKLGNPMIIDWGGKHWRGTQKAIDEARAGGHDGIIIKNVKDHYNNSAKTKATDIAVVFDPENIRSVDAAFDPAEKGSSNIMAGAAGVGIATRERKEDQRDRRSRR